MMDTKQNKESSTQDQSGKQPYRNLYLGYFLIILSIVLFIIGQFLVKTMFKLGQFSILSLLGIPLIILGLSGVALGYHLIQRDGEKQVEKAAKEDKPLFLFLRSFADEESSGLSPKEMTEEQVLQFFLKNSGEFVAIGKPGEKLATLGASRLYVENSEWQEKVQELATRSQLIIIRVGKTPGLGWEIENIVNKTDPQKVLLYIPQAELGVYERLGEWFRIKFFKQMKPQVTVGEKTYDIFRKNFSHLLPTLPSEISRSPFVRFDEQWNPILLKRKKSNWLCEYLLCHGRNPREVNLPGALQPLFDEGHLKPATLAGIQMTPQIVQTIKICTFAFAYLFVFILIGAIFISGFDK